MKRFREKEKRKVWEKEPWKDSRVASHRVVDTPADDLRPVVAELNENHSVPVPCQHAHLLTNPPLSPRVHEVEVESIRKTFARAADTGHSD